jgi:hypothetical protein
MKLFNFLWLPVAGVVGASYLAQANSPQSQPQSKSQPETLKVWKIQPVAVPIIDQKTAHQALLARQKQLADKNFSCDCNGCRVFAQQVGVTFN